MCFVDDDQPKPLAEFLQLLTADVVVILPVNGVQLLDARDRHFRVGPDGSSATPQAGDDQGFTRRRRSGWRTDQLSGR